MGVEGMRVLYPTLYAAIRDNKETFTHAFDPEEYPDFDAVDGIHQFSRTQDETEIQRRVDRAMTDANEDEKTSGRALVRILFERAPPAEQGVARTRYFDRYFSYGLAADGIGDVEIDTLTARPETEADEQEKAALLGRLIARNAGQLVRLLLVRLPRFDMVTALAVARLIIANGARFVEVDALDPRRVAFLLAHLVLHAGTIEELSIGLSRIAGGVLAEAGSHLPLVLALDLYEEFDRAVVRAKRRSEEQQSYQQQQHMRSDLRVVLSGRLKAQAEADWRSMMAPRANGRILLHDWNRFDMAAQRTWLAGLLAERPEAVAPFLRACIKDATELSFSVNQDLIRSMTDMEPLIGAASRPAARANEAQDTEVIKAFLAWAKASAGKG
jgi:hypothetical protein